jgi:holo-[acyl-carrier protein] synthase
VGVDIEEVSRFQKLMRNRRFLNRVFTAGEIAYCNSKKNKAQHFAVRFAAKEAIWKALSEVIRKSKKPMGHREIGIRNSASGKPEAVLPNSFSRWQKKIAVSLSHSKAYAVAVAFVEG